MYFIRAYTQPQEFWDVSRKKLNQSELAFNYISQILLLTSKEGSLSPNRFVVMVNLKLCNRFIKYLQKKKQFRYCVRLLLLLGF